MIHVSVKAEVQEAVKALDELGVEMKFATAKILAVLATETKKVVQKNMGKYLRIRSGWLQRHVYGRRRSASHYVVAAPTHIAEILERGGTIAPRKGRHLRFIGKDGGWKTSRQVTIPARRWFSSSIAGWEGSPEFSQALEKGIAKAIRRWLVKVDSRALVAGEGK